MTVTHRKSRTREHRIWCAMKTRCTNPKAAHYADYGGRGIAVCDRWSKSFEAFLADMGPCPADYSIDRIDNNGNYEPSNCRWASVLQQRNNKRNSKLITHNGQTKTESEWARDLGIKRESIRARLKGGWSVEDALMKPRRPTNRLAPLRLITHNGETLSLTDWARRAKIGRGTIAARLRFGWSMADALSLPPDNHRKYAGVEKAFDRIAKA